MIEIWKTIENYPNYEVSNMGEVRRKSTQRVLKPQILGGKNGYKAVYLAKSRGDKQKWEYVHRLVAIHFIPNPNDYPIVNHLGEKMDCRAINLEWCDAARNRVFRPEQRRIYTRRHYEKHKEEILARKKAYYEAHREELLKKRHEQYMNKKNNRATV